MAKRAPKRTDENSASVLVRMPPKTAADLTDRAARLDLNREQLIRRVLREWLDK